MFEAATIQTMPKISWGQRETSARPADVFAVDDIVVCSPTSGCRCGAERLRDAYDSRPESSREVSGLVRGSEVLWLAAEN